VEGEVMLYHYTCDHGAAGIERDGELRVQERTVRLDWLPNVIWLTDLDVPVAEALGLTSRTLECDRTANRFVVAEPKDVQRYVDVRRSWSAFVRDALETAAGAMPMHWYVTTTPQVAVRG
jgi:hypothetical protein